MKRKIDVKNIKLILLIFLGMILLALASAVILHTHSFGEWVTESEPSCTRDGIRARYCLCGKEQKEVIARLAHTDGDWQEDAESATRSLLCAVCGTVIRTEEIPAHIHVWGEWTTVTESTCEKCGKLERRCECGALDQKETEALDHSFGAWYTRAVATCEAEGCAERQCSRCKKVESITLAPLGHKATLSYIKDGTIYHYCPRCSKILRTESSNTESSELEIVNGVVVGIGTCTDTVVVVPTVHDGIPVTAIDARAFEGNTSITSVILPESIRSIGDKAFYGCSSLASIDLSGVAEIGKVAFGYCSSLSILRFGNGLCTIGTWAFEYCSALTDMSFAGTPEQWAEVEKGDDWRLGVPENVSIRFDNVR